MSSHVVTMQLPSRYVVDRFLHRPLAIILCMSDVVTVQWSQCRGLENSDFIVTVVVTA